HIWFLLLLPVVALTWITASVAEEQYRRAAFGTEGDIAVIRSLDRRIVYFDDGLSGEPGWGGGTRIPLYTDPLFPRPPATGARERCRPTATWSSRSGTSERSPRRRPISRTSSASRACGSTARARRSSFSPSARPRGEGDRPFRRRPKAGRLRASWESTTRATL